MREAKPREIAEALSFALIHDGRKRVHDADGLIADVVAKRLVQHLDQAGFVIMKRTHPTSG
jgi:hypothetical protein